jgi:4-hydroxybenzoate polyprenyltransferase
MDLHLERCKVRPLPAGMISVKGAILAFIAWLAITLGITWGTLGDKAVISFFPVWVIGAMYPFLKRLIPFPQVILGAVIGGAVFPGWVSVTNQLDGVVAAIPLFFATASWVVYFDTFHATHDIVDDAKIGDKSLANLAGGNARILLSVLGMIQIIFFTLTAMKAQLSLIFWILGLGVWTLSIPWHIKSWTSMIGNQRGYLQGQYQAWSLFDRSNTTKTRLHPGVPHFSLVNTRSSFLEEKC